MKAVVLNPFTSCQWTCHPALCMAHCKLNIQIKFRGDQAIETLPNNWKTNSFQKRLVAQAVLAMIARFFATYAMNTGFQFTVEVKRLGQAWNDEKWQVLPTQLRGQGMALVNVMSMFSQMASPVFVYSVGVQSPPWRLFIVQICRVLFLREHLLYW